MEMESNIKACDDVDVVHLFAAKLDSNSSCFTRLVSTISGEFNIFSTQSIQEHLPLPGLNISNYETIISLPMEPRELSRLTHDTNFRRKYSTKDMIWIEAEDISIRNPEFSKSIDALAGQVTDVLGCGQKIPFELKLLGACFESGTSVRTFSQGSASMSQWNTGEGFEDHSNEKNASTFAYISVQVCIDRAHMSFHFNLNTYIDRSHRSLRVVK